MIREILLKYKYLIFFILGFFNSLPFVFNGLYWISWFSFSLLFVFLSVINSNKGLYVCINLFYFSYYLGAYNFFHALYPLTFAGIGYIASFFILTFAWLFLSFVHSSILSLGTYLSYRIFNRNGIAALSSALLFVFGQYLISAGPWGFPWGRYSTAQYYNPYLIQTSSLLGPYFVDLLIISVNLFVALTFLSKRKTKYALAFIFIFLVNFFYGLHSISSNNYVDRKLNVAIVQGNVLTDEKWHGKSSFRTYMNETYAIESADMVVWGETAIPLELNTSYSTAGEIIKYSKSTDTELIVGAFYENELGEIFNGAYYINERGLSEDIYFKRKLVPFGEFLPFRKLLDMIPFLDNINMLSYDLTSGKLPLITETDNGKIGCLICFDSVYPNLARTSVKNGAELITIITNDSWYKDSSSVFLHNGQAVWRAVENGRWIVRSANSGISSFITPKGKIISSIPPLTKGKAIEDVYFLDELTLYTKVGDIIILPIVLVWIFIYLYEKKKGFCKSKSTNS